MECFRELPDKSSSDNSLGMELLGSPKPSLTSQVTTRLLLTTMVVTRVSVFKVQ